MTTAAQSLAETFVRMLNKHDPDLVDQFVADNYRNHNAFVGDGREANRRFWAGFFAALPDLTATMEDLVIAGDRVSGASCIGGPMPVSAWEFRPRVEASRCARSISGGWTTGCSSSTGMN